MVLYTDKQGDFILSGAMVSTTTTENLTQRFTDEIEIDLSGIGVELEALKSISEGEGDNVIYAIVDTNCGYCRRTFNSMKTVHEQNVKNLRVEWIPVGGNDAKLFGVDDENQINALEKALNRQDFSQMYEIDTSKVEGERENVEDNGLWMNKMGYRGVPIVISNIEGKWNVREGAPPNNFYSELVNTLTDAKLDAFNDLMSTKVQPKIADKIDAEVLEAAKQF